MQMSWRHDESKPRAAEPTTGLPGFLPSCTELETRYNSGKKALQTGDGPTPKRQINSLRHSPNSAPPHSSAWASRPPIASTATSTRSTCQRASKNRWSSFAYGADGANLISAAAVAADVDGDGSARNRRVAVDDLFLLPRCLADGPFTTVPYRESSRERYRVPGSDFTRENGKKTRSAPHQMLPRRLRDVD